MSKKIIGVTVGTQLPKPNFKQTDPTKGDYIRNKPDFDGLKDRVDTVSGLVGDTSVSEQINTALDNYAISWDDLSNKPFGEEDSRLIYVPYTEIKNVAFLGYNTNLSNVVFVFDGTMYKLTYKCGSSEDYTYSCSWYGNDRLLPVSVMREEQETDLDVPFVVYYTSFSEGESDVCILFEDPTVDHTIEVYAETAKIKCLDEKFIPYTIARASDIEVLDAKIGYTSVSEQIANAVSQKSQVQIITWGADD